MHADGRQKTDSRELFDSPAVKQDVPALVMNTVGPGGLRWGVDSDSQGIIDPRATTNRAHVDSEVSVPAYPGKGFIRKRMEANEIAHCIILKSGVQQSSVR